MKKIQVTIAIILLLFTACTKEQLIGITDHHGVIYGYWRSNPGNVPNFGIVNPHTGTATSTAGFADFNLINSNQAMMLPEGVYVVPRPNAVPTPTDIGLVYRFNLHTNVVDNFSTQTTDLTRGLVYSPVSQKTYAIQGDNIFDYTVDENSTPKKMQKGRVYPGLGLNPGTFQISSTAHGYLPYIYAVDDFYGGTNSTIRKLDISTDIYSTIIPDSPNVLYTGIRYNPHDSMVYVVKSYFNPSTGFNYLSDLMQLNPLTNQVSFVVRINNSAVNFFQYSATIHCCENMYVLRTGGDSGIGFATNYFFNIDIVKKTVEVVISDNWYQGLFWGPR